MDTSPAPALKDGFSKATVAGIAQLVAVAHPAFDAPRFKRLAGQQFDALSLMARVRRVAETLAATLPSDFSAALAIIERALDEPPATQRVGEGIAAFRIAPFLEWVAIAGVGTPDTALPALARLTKHFTAEFAIRAFLEAHLDLTLDHTAHWVADPDPRVRRLASEGTRPLLPWGRHIAALKRDPARALALIAPLAADPDEVVRRSAANHLNDVSRLDPDLALAHATHWTHTFGSDAAGTVRHAVRTLVKKGHPEALQLLGFDTHADVRLTGLALSARSVPVGGEIELTAALHSTGGEPVSACVDYAVRYASARGAVRVKVFKGTQVTLVPGQACPLRFRRDFVPRTTRALYPGPHAVEVRVNGVVVGEAPFDLV